MPQISADRYNFCMNTGSYLRLVFASALLCGGMAFAQRNVTPDSVPTPTPLDPSIQRMQTEAALARNAERQKVLTQDTQKLLKLANELNEAVNRSTQNTLSLEVIRKAEEIEKLAKQVKEKMKGD
jgi:hypothetical protein